MKLDENEPGVGWGRVLSGREWKRLKCLQWKNV